VVIEQLLEKLDRQGIVVDRAQVLQDLMARERQGSTGLGRGVALPHAKSNAVLEPAVAFGRSLEGVDFETLDGDSVHLIFLLIVPRTRSGLALKIVSALSRFLRDDANRRRLMEAAGPEEIRKILKEISVG